MFKYIIVLILTVILLSVKFIQVLFYSKKKLRRVTDAEWKAHKDLDNETEEAYEYRQYLISEKARLYDGYERLNLICNALALIDFIIFFILML